MALTANQQAFLRNKGGAHHNQGANDPAGTGLTAGQVNAGDDGGVYQINGRNFSTKNAGWREAMCIALGVS